MKTCPKCDNGAIQSLACPGGRILIRPCDYCRGTGLISAEQAYAIQQGERARDDRRRRGLTGTEEAARLGMDPVQYNYFEQGRPYVGSPDKKVQP